MEKQPDKLDILMDWFLGDAKEITSKLESVTTSVTETVGVSLENGKYPTLSLFYKQIGLI